MAVNLFSLIIRVYNRGVDRGNLKYKEKIMLNQMLLTVAETAKIMHTSREFVYVLIHEGLLRAMKLGSYKIRMETLETFLKDVEDMEITMPNNSGKLSIRKMK